MAKIPKNNASRLLAKAIAASSIASYLLDSEGKLLFANHALAKLLGVTDDHLKNLECIPLAADQSPSDSGTLNIPSVLSCPPMIGSQRFFRGSFPIPPSRQNLNWERLGYKLDSSDRSATLCFVLPRTSDMETDSGSAIPGANESEAIHQKLVAIRHRFAHLDGLVSLVGSSSLAKRTLHQVHAAIAGNSSVCILGPEGSGKVEVARAIFVGRNKRLGMAESAAQLFPVDCRLMDAGLLANLFEVIDGSNPKGAAGKRTTLLLDRIDLLPPEAHFILLKYLEKNKSNGILATTTTPLTECHASQSNWMQIVSRIDIQPVVIAPMTQRPEDIPLVTQAILHGMHREKSIAKIPLIDSASMNLLQAYGWPNNIRELREALRGISSTQPSKIEVHHLPVAIRTFASYIESENSAMEAIDLDALLLSVEKSIIEGVLERTSGNRALAARQLGISRTRLLRRLEQLGLSVDGEESNKPTEAVVKSKTLVPEPVKNRAPESKKTTEKSSVPEKSSIPDKPSVPAKSDLPDKSNAIDDEIEFTEIDFEESEGES